MPFWEDMQGLLELICPSIGHTEGMGVGVVIGGEWMRTMVAVWEDVEKA